MLEGPLERIDRPQLQRLVDGQVAEGRTIDFKSEGVGTDEGAKRDFLVDVSALANTQGGHIIYGLAERDGVAAALTGFQVSSRDAEIQRLENVLRDGVDPRIPSVQLHWVDLDAGNRALIVRVRPSLIGPHRVKYRGHDKFYRRNSSGNAPMDTFELRAAFAATDGLSRTMRALHDAQVTGVIEGTGPVSLKEQPYFIVTVVPFSALGSEIELELNFQNALQPIHSPRNIDWFNTLEGFVTCDANLLAHCYTLTGRKGYTHTIFKPAQGNDELYIQYVEQDLSLTVKSAVEKLNDFELYGPYNVFVSLTAASSLRADWNEHQSLGPRSRPQKRSTLDLPPVVVDEYSDKAIEPIRRSLCHAFGFDRTRGKAPGMR